MTSQCKTLNKSILGKINFNYVINFAGNIDHSNKNSNLQSSLLWSNQFTT